MTLLLTHVTSLGIVFAADRAIVMQNTSGVITGFVGFKQKIFQLPHLNAGVGFFGQATVNNVPMDVWLTDFIKVQESSSSLFDFASALKNRLENEQKRTLFGTGFHICGYSNRSRLGREFYFLKNYNTLADLWANRLTATFELRDHLPAYLPDSPPSGFWAVDLHNGTLHKYNEILNRKFAGLSKLRETSRMPKFTTSISNYERYVASIFEQVILQYRAEAGIAPVNTDNGKPDIFTVHAPGNGT